MDDSYAAILLQLDSLYTITQDPDYRSDKGLILILQQKYEAAIRIYKDIEQTHPGRYATAANPGTAYELSGQNELALKWIQKAVAIDPASHDSSEWLHVNILKAKIEGGAYATIDSLLGTHFDIAVAPFWDWPLRKVNATANALFYQLNERVTFVHPKDMLIAQLLFELGNLRLLQRDKECVVACYESAKEYGFSDPLINTRIVQAQQLLAQQSSGYAPPARKNKPAVTMFIGPVFLMLSALTVFYVAKRKRRRQGH
jgi:tetratricopeptide (TPR) repeat protein